ncbi:MAG: hypothetical protein M1814_000653 [Vezdaea aestivalis]|nr:MAG: hypothetical protein M1814_000653 [Vezdaea aestivalis]
MSGGQSSLQATYTGHVATTQDALVLFEACLAGTLHHVPRRPHDRERTSLIQSGCVFIYEENASGIKRWTDGVPWSPSRILGNFLVYRELDKPFPPGEKKRATKRGKRPAVKPGEPYPRSGIDNGPGTPQYSPTTPMTPGFRDAPVDREMERQLIGSLVDSYGFKADGLVKKTMSVNVNGVHHHLVSYYKVHDVMSGQMKTPTTDPLTHNHKPRVELSSRQNFRAPINDSDDIDQVFENAPRQAYAYDRRPTLGGPSYSSGQAQNGYSFPAGDNGYSNGGHPYSAASSYNMTTSSSSPNPAFYGASMIGPTSQQPVKGEELGHYGQPQSYGSISGNYVSNGHGREYPSRLRNGEVEIPPLDTKGADSYRYGYSSTPRSDSASTSSYQGMENRGWSQTSSAARSEHTPAYSPKQQYSSGWAPNPLNLNNGHYAQPPPLSQWHQQQPM